MGNSAVRQVQIGQEPSAGTLITPTARWRGIGGFPDDLRELVFPDENIGSIPGKDRSYTARHESEFQFPATEASFEQLPYIFMSGIDDVSGVQDGAGSGYVYTYTLPTTSVPAVGDIKTLSLYGGDDVGTYAGAYCFCKEFTLSGVWGEALMIEALFGGRSTETNALETLSLPAVETIRSLKGKVYIDDDDGSIGGTQVSNMIREFTLNVTTGWVPRFTFDGELYFSHAIFAKPEITLELKFDHKAGAVTERGNWLSETARLIRLEFEGSALDTSDTYTYKTLTIDLAGKWEKFDIPEDDDGITTVTGTFKVLENDTASLYAEIVLVNELSAIP